MENCKTPLPYFESYDNIIFVSCRHVGMADEADSKSVVGNYVWVQVPPSAPKRFCNLQRRFFLPISLKCVTSIPKCVIIDSKPILDNPEFLSFQKGATPPLTLTLQNPAWQSLFSVPTAVVDQYLKLATPSQLKVLSLIHISEPTRLA